MRTLRAAVALGLVALTVTPIEPNPNPRVAEPPRYAGPTSRIDWPEIGRVARWVASVAAEQPRTPPPPRVKQRRVSVSSGDGSVWDRIAACESGGDWATNTSNGYFGGLQMNMQFWRSYGGPEFATRPDLATREQQIVIAERARDSGRGYGPWPVCGRRAA